MTPIVHDNTVARWLLVLILAAGVYFFIGFLVPLLAALIVGFASWPLYQRLHRLCLGSNVLAASIALIIIIVGLIVPISMAFSFALQEVKIWIDWLLVANREGISTPEWITALPGAGSWLTQQWQEHLSEPNALGSIVHIFSGDQIGNISRWLLALSGSTFNLLLAIVFMLISLFFIYKDGARLAGQLDIVGERMLPARWKRFSRVVPTTVSSTVVGMGLIAMGEGVVLGVAYWIAGVPSPVVLGVLTGFMALIPGGAPLMFTLVSLYLLGSGELASALGLFLWGSTELFIVDKTLRPRLVGGPIKLPFLPTFFGLIGGVKTMGIIGLFVGPVLMALLVAIWHEWLREADQEYSDYPVDEITSCEH